MEQVRKNFESACFVLGLADYSSTPKFQKVYARFLYINVIAFNVMCISSFFTADTLFIKLQLLVFAVAVFGSAQFFFAFYHQNQGFKSSLVWCEQLQAKPYASKAVTQSFTDAAARASKIFGLIRKVLLTVYILAYIQAIPGLIEGKVELPYPLYMPFFPKEKLYSRLLAALEYYLSGCTVIHSMIAVYGVLLAVIIHIMALMRSIEILTTETRIIDIEFLETVKVVIDMHVDLVERLNILIELTRPAILAFEFCVYGVLLFNWVALFHYPSILFLGAALYGLFMCYLLVCWINESLISEFEKFTQSIYDMEWYAAEPNRRRSLLLLLMVSQRPKLLMAGPFHVVSYQNLGAILQRVYSFGIMINNVITAL